MSKVFQEVGVLMGGVSAERDVSMRSGRAVAAGLRQAGRNVVEVDVRGRSLDLPAGLDGVFIALHGEFGEDGEVQELLESEGVPYTGAGPGASRLAFDKKLAKEMMLSQNIPTPDFEVLAAGGRRKLDLPVVVKPVSQGSSFGVHKVLTESEWDAALADALGYGSRVLVESFIAGRELTVGIVCGEAMPVIDIRAPGNNYDFHAKYTKGVTEYLVPAPLDAGLTRMCRELSVRTFNALRCKGLGRVDLRLTDDGIVYVLELNTIPGFTETSLLPKAALAAGYAFPDLCDRIMQAASLEGARQGIVIGDAACG